jgi:hypothetical protein
VVRPRESEGGKKDKHGTACEREQTRTDRTVRHHVLLDKAQHTAKQLVIHRRPHTLFTERHQPKKKSGDKGEAVGLARKLDYRAVWAFFFNCAP